MKPWHFKQQSIFHKYGSKFEIILNPLEKERVGLGKTEFISAFCATRQRTAEVSNGSPARKKGEPIRSFTLFIFCYREPFFRRSVDQDRRRPCFGAKVARGDRVSKTSCCSSWFEMGFFRPRRNASDALFIDEPHVHACIFRPSRRPNTSQQCQWENGESTGYFEQNCLTHGLFSEGRRGGECFCLLPCLHFCWKTERNHFHCNILYCNIIFLKCSFEMWV